MQHGGDLSRAAEAYAIERWKWLDLSTGINPNGYVIEDLAQSCFHELPDGRDLMQLAEAARAAYGVPDAQGLIAAPGSEFLIQAIPQIRKISKVAIVSPTFSSHEGAWRRYGHQVRQVANIDDIDDETVVILVNPNNPDGRVTKAGKLAKLARKLAETGGLLVIDEAFADVMPEVSLVPRERHENVIILRSIGKFYGLAGVRLGFAIGPNRFLDPLRTILGAWAVSGPAIEIGRRVLSDADWQEQTRAVLRVQASQHRDLFEKYGLKVVGGTPLFHLIELDDARTLHHQLAKRAVWTRLFDYNVQWLRVGLCRTQADLRQFGQQLEAALRVSQAAA